MTTRRQTHDTDAPKALRAKAPVARDKEIRGLRVEGKDNTRGLDSQHRRAGGRPTLYRERYVDLILQFFRVDLERQVEVVRTGKDGKPETTAEPVVNRFPTLERFADSIGVDRKTLHAWATATNADGRTLKHPEFACAYVRAKDLQAALVIEGGMGKIYDPRFASLAAKNLMGWRDKIAQTVTATVTQATIAELDSIYLRGMEKARRRRAAVEFPSRFSASDNRRN